VTAVLIVLYVLVCLFLIMVVLLQQGKGADLAGAFGGGGSQTSFGPRTTTNIMHRMTTGAFVLFVILCLALAIMSGKQRTSVMENVTVPAGETTPVEPALGPGEAAQPPPENVLEEAAAEENAEGEMTPLETPAVPQGDDGN
jgi:preprotein translocase subunit SecG